MTSDKNTPWLYKHKSVPMMGVNSLGTPTIPQLCNGCPCDGLYHKQPIIFFFRPLVEFSEILIGSYTIANLRWKPMLPYDTITGDRVGWQPPRWDGTTWISGYWAETKNSFLNRECRCSEGYITDISWFAEPRFINNSYTTAINEGYTWWLRCVDSREEQPTYLNRDFTVGMYDYGNPLGDVHESVVKDAVKYYIKDRYDNDIGYRIYNYSNHTSYGSIPNRQTGSPPLPEGTVGLLTINQSCTEDCEVMVIDQYDDTPEPDYMTTAEVSESIYDMDDNLISEWNYGSYTFEMPKSGNCSTAFIIKTEPVVIPSAKKVCVYSFESLYDSCCAWSEPRKYQSDCTIEQTTEFDVWKLDSSGCRATIKVKGDDCNGLIACSYTTPETPTKPDIEPTGPSCSPASCRVSNYMISYSDNAHYPTEDDSCIPFISYGYWIRGSGVINNPYNCNASLRLWGEVTDNYKIISQGYNGFVRATCQPRLAGPPPGYYAFSITINIKSKESITVVPGVNYGKTIDDRFASSSYGVIYFSITPIKE